MPLCVEVKIVLNLLSVDSNDFFSSYIKRCIIVLNQGVGVDIPKVSFILYLITNVICYVAPGNSRDRTQ